MFGFAPLARLTFCEVPQEEVSVEVYVTGVEALGIVGQVTVGRNAQAYPSGVDGLGIVGYPTFRITAAVHLTGVVGRGRVSRIPMWTPIICDEDGHWQNNPCSGMATWVDTACGSNPDWEDIPT